MPKPRIKTTRVWSSDVRQIHRIADELSTKSNKVGSKEVIAVLIDLYDHSRCRECGTMNYPTKCLNCNRE